MQPIYVGKAKDLRRRWDQHTDFSEPNPGLFLAGQRCDLEFWWSTVPLRDLDEVESETIRALQPAANRRGKADPRSGEVPISRPTGTRDAALIGFCS